MIAFSQRIAGAVLSVGLLAGAALMATGSGASAAPDHRFHGGGGVHGHGAPGFHGGWHGRGGWYGYGVGWRRGYYPPIFPGYGYWGVPYVRYNYPYYVYPSYVLPTAVYATVAPRPHVAAPAVHPHEFTVYFDFDQYHLTPAGQRVVDSAIAAAHAGGPARVTIIGNTDRAGTSRYNYILSERRAETVRRYMVAHGVEAGEIGVEAHGESNPAVPTANGVREPRNRRVEIIITPEGGPRHYAPPATSMARPPMTPANARMSPPPPPPPAGSAPPAGAGSLGQPTNLVNP